MNAKIIFPKEPDFFYKDVCREVQEYFETNNLNKYGNNPLVIKYVLLKIIFVGCYLFLFHFQSSWVILFLFFALGPLSIILAINISHDAIHGVAHSNKWINTYFSIQMDLIGANSYVWKRRHQFGHHIFPNTVGKDPDLTQTEVVKILPKASHKYYHRFQHIYVPLLYAVYTINWIYIRDFTDFFSKKTLIKNIPLKEYVKLIGFKLFYVTLFIFIPVFFTSLSVGLVLLGNLLMHIAASYFLTLALIPSHVSENSVFVSPDANGKMPYSWSHHQVMTTTDFATESSITTFLLGGFNHHITHHLFPKYSHIHYPKMTPIIKRLAINYGLTYNHENNVVSAYMSHFNLLKNNGKH